MNISAISFVLYSVLIFFFGMLYLYAMMPDTKGHKMIMDKLPIPEKYSMLAISGIIFTIIFIAALAYVLVMKYAD